MIRNYAKIAWRNLMANKAFTAINIVGLTVGIASCILMCIYLRFELSFDKFHTKSDSIVRVIMEYKSGNEGGNRGNFTSAKVLPKFQETFPEIISGVRLTNAERLVKVEDKMINESNFLYADSTFFTQFDFDLIKGDPKTVLNRPNAVVITKSTAKKYFCDAEHLLQTIFVGSSQEPYIVTGVVEDCPKNSQINFDFVASLSSLGKLLDETYWNANYNTYLLLNDAESSEAVQTKINAFMEKEFPASEGTTIQFFLEKFTSVHLYSPYDAIRPNTNIVYIYIVLGRTLLLLLIACFTYINLTTARSVERAREVGIRKANGARKGQLFWQFISESVVITGISLVLSFWLAATILPLFNRYSEMNFLTADVLNVEILIAGFILFLVISILAGSYPAIVLTSYNAVSVLKGSFTSSPKGMRVGNSLMVFQFVISIVLVISTLIVKSQMDYIQNKRLGYEKERSLTISLDGKSIDKLQLIKSEIGAIDGVASVGSAYNSPMNINGGYNMSDVNINIQRDVKANPIDEKFLEACKIKLLAGENISKQDIILADNRDDPKFAYILNETAVKLFGWSVEEAIGKKMYLGESRPGVVKGVIEDFHFKSLHTTINPLVLFPSSYTPVLIIRTEAGRDINQVAKVIEAKMKTIAPHRPFEFSFMDTSYANLYVSERRTEKVFNALGLIALLLTCLGLYGLSTYTIKQRFKEIGVRKVLGANLGGLIVKLTGGFMKLVVIGFILAIPITYWGMSNWLENFAYSIKINGWVFALGALIIGFISLCSVSYQTIKAALMNPVKSLRD